MTGSTKAAYANPPDAGPMRVWQQVLVSGDLFVDIGANVGTYSLIAAETGASLIAVEPNDEARGWLTRNLSLNDVQARVLDVAMGARKGHAAFTTGLGSTNHLDRSGRQLVRIDTLDSLLGPAAEAMVKMDVEGFELDVLRGATNALAEQRLRVIQIEWNRDRDGIRFLLEEHGYELYEADSDGSLIPYTSAPDVFAVAHGFQI